MNFAIIGAGFIYERHKQVIEEMGHKVYMVCDVDSKKKHDWINYRNMFESGAMQNVDAIIICTPNYLHPEMVRDALRTGKPVLCEKPLTITTDFDFMEGVNVVLQLRYHPKFKEICEKMKTAKKIDLVMKAYRDENFWNCWKGDEAKSGGLVYILGSHIFDLLLCAFDDNYDLVEANDSMKLSTGKIMFGETEVNFHLEFLDNREGQTRHILIDGEEFILSLRDNLSFEGLHDKVYEAFLNGTAPQLYDVKRSIILMDKIKKFKT